MEGVASTPSGLVRGSSEEGVWVFRGVPYARAPVGRLRWREPEPVPWWYGVRDAEAWGAISPQGPPVPGMSIDGDPADWDEDCLNLNIWTPALDDGRRPVMVWLHGGGFTSGSGSSILYRGRYLAARGDVVVVTLNYRLGALGFLAHPALAAAEGSESGNWGLLDQLAALRWIGGCIESFGGDPANVTVFGESAGGMSVTALLGTSAAGELFHRAIVQSGPAATGSTRWGARQAGRLAELLGLREISRAALEKTAPDELVSATQRLGREFASEGELPLPFLPVTDGPLLSRPPEQAVAAGSASSVPLLIGTTRDECTFFTLANPRVAGLDVDGVKRWTAAISGPEAAGAIVDAYVQARADRDEPVAPTDLWSAIATDVTFRLPSMSLATEHARHQPDTFTYLFEWESPFLGGILGSCHAIEIPFVFGTVEESTVPVFIGSGPEVDNLSQSMSDAWLSFARTGNPSCDVLGDWPRFDGNRATMILGPSSGIRDDPRSEERRIWEDCGVTLGSGHHHR